MNLSEQLAKALENTSGICDLLLQERDKVADSKGDYFDIKGDEITYLPHNKVDANLDPYETRGRVSVKAGRFFRRVFEENTAHLYGALQDREVELLAARFSAMVIPLEENPSFRVVRGEDIRFWYNGENYATNSGGLSASCMQNKKLGKYFDLYVENPDYVQMLIHTNAQDKLTGRALIFTDVDGNQFCNTIRYSTETSAELFKRWMLRNNVYMLPERYYYGSEQPERVVYMELPNWDFDAWPSIDYIWYTDNKGTWSNHNARPTTYKHTIGWRRNSPNGRLGHDYGW